MSKDYVIKSGDEHLVWWEAGTAVDHDPAVAHWVRRLGDQCHWVEVEGQRWMWIGGNARASRFEWNQARDIVWNKLKANTHCFGVKRPEPIADRWAYTLTRIVPKGDSIRPRSRK